jgi:hypothetical protein
MISVRSPGGFRNTDRFLRKMSSGAIFEKLSQEARRGVDALSLATPRESGATANSWTYDIVRTRKSVKIIWRNSHVVNGQLIAILIQYGHGTGTGGYVQGRDYINPAIQPIFDSIAEDLWKEVNAA